MSFLGRIANGAAGAAHSSVERSHPAAGRMLTVGDLVHAPRRASRAALQPEGWGHESSAERAADQAADPAAGALPEPGVVATTGSAARTAQLHSSAAEERATVIATNPPTQRMPIAPGVQPQPSLQAHGREPVAAPAPFVLRPPAALEQQPVASAAPPMRSRSADAAGVESHQLPSERGSDTEIDIAVARPVAAVNAARSDATRATPNSAPAARMLGTAAMAVPPAREAAGTQQLPVSAVAVADRGGPQPAQHALPDPRPAAASSQVAAPPRAEMLAAPRESRPAAAAALQPLVQIGSIEVIVAAPVEPSAAPSTALRGASFSSRHYLRGL